MDPAAEREVPVRFAIEADALHRNYDISNANTSSSVGSWEFPIVLKKKFLPGPLKPYLEAGLSFSHLEDIPNVSINS